ncbi:hypothetical protein ACWD3D_35425, partial [Streptomyces sp. NPDC002690]
MTTAETASAAAPAGPGPLPHDELRVPVEGGELAVLRWPASTPSTPPAPFPGTPSSRSASPWRRERPRPSA